jgi:hypothetical protein
MTDQIQRQKVQSMCFPKGQPARNRSGVDISWLPFTPSEFLPPWCISFAESSNVWRTRTGHHHQLGGDNHGRSHHDRLMPRGTMA